MSAGMNNVEDNGRFGSITPAARMRAAGPILLLAALFCLAVFLSWYFSWFGRGLSNEDITRYLDDEKHPRHVQHALLQIQQRLEKGDSSARQWYPRIIALSRNPETEFRLTVAWVMGSDSSSEEFHQALRQLLSDTEPIVRRNAALALLRFKDAFGRSELLAILEPYTVKAPKEGVVASSLKPDSSLTRGTLVARIQSSDGTSAEVRSPLPGKIDKILVANGTPVAVGGPLLTINCDDGSVWEALRGLALVGEPGDVTLVQQYLQRNTQAQSKIAEQAKLTIETIQQRTKK
jgi:HEAT repeats